MSLRPFKLRAITHQLDGAIHGTITFPRGTAQ